MAGRQLETLMQQRPVLVVSLPRNEVDLAEAALEGGADGLKVHLNLEHHASGTYFGPWREEADTIQQILSLGVPVGMVPGTRERMISPAETAEIEAAGIDFVDAYVQDMPAWLPDQVTNISVMAALSYADAESGWNLGHLQGCCQLLEASIIRPDEYRKPLQDEDIAAYASISERHPDLPALVPTQRAIRPEQVSEILGTGMRGILIGAIVTGQVPESLCQATREFALALSTA